MNRLYYGDNLDVLTQTLADAQTDGQRLPSAVMIAYQDTITRTNAELGRFRLMLADLKSRITVH
jgi:hypothetical protein